MGETLLIKNAAELVTCSGSAPKTGAAMNDLGIIHDGAVLVEDGIITKVGATAELLSAITGPVDKEIDAAGKCVLPGFVDSHTHFVFGGYRAEEFSWRLRGDTYMEIMERGGGIVNTVRDTRLASKQELKELARKRLDSMLALGVTTVEGKSGYGLDLDTEIKQLEVMAELQGEQAVEIVTTFMGAHAVPQEYQGRSGEFIDFLINEVLPVVAERKLAEFCDVFCEKGVFSVDESRRLLLAASKLGMKSKLHADEIVQLGGAELAAELAAVSADHLLHVSDEGIRKMAETKVVATLLPATAFSLKEPYARGRVMIDSGVPVALASDFNPGSCFTGSIPLIIALATLYMGLTPAETISALTINAAAAVDKADKIGSIESGKQADIIILEHPSHLYLPYHIGVSIVETVIKKGKVVWSK
ncbi:Imidazolonepropionase [Sporomusa carbonis]|uniref:imidazolonepropionase n=1 Tax=Sporomusa carbonis TaxID=3076075 RepID=UPI003A7A6F41